MVKSIVVVLSVYLLTTVAPVVPAEGAELLSKIAAFWADDSYETKVAAVREEFAVERRVLNCDPVLDLGTPESDLGRPKCQNAGGGAHMGGGSSSADPTRTANSSSCLSSSKGAPAWAVNMVNMNFYMEDTPLWYRSPVGPSVEIVFSYNSWYPIGWGRPVANKWVMNYDSHLLAYSEVGSSGMWVVLPDGKHDQYPVNGVENGWETYASPYNTYSKLSRISQTRFELKFPEGKTYVYDIPQGSSSTVSMLVEEKDAYGQKLIFGYDSNDRLITITDALGKITHFYYDASGNISQITDPFSRSAYFEYDAGGNLTKITDMGGYWTSFAYDANLLPAGLTNGQGSWGFYFEPPDGISNGGDPYPAPGTAMEKSYRITVTNPDGGKEEYYRGVGAWYISPKNYVPYVSASNNNYASNSPKTTYDYFWAPSTDRGEVDAITSPGGIETGFNYDSNGNITGMSVPGGGLAFTYNELGKVTSVTDGTTLTAPITTMTYADNKVDLTGITDGLGTVTIAYNDFHDVTSITDRLNETRTFTFNGYGQMTSETDQLGFITTYIYNSNHLLSQVTKEGQNIRSYTYDSLGAVKTYTDASGMTLTFDYNNLDDITKITYPDGKYISIAYSTAVPHLITQVTDRSGRITNYGFSASKLLTGIVNAEGGTTGFHYDANGKISKLTDPLGNATEFVFNNDNKLVQKKFADQSSVSFAYDDLQGYGRLSSYTNARSSPVLYSYMLGDLKTIVYDSSGSFNYDEYHRLTGTHDDSGDSVYVYDENSRLTSVDGPLEGDTITFGYDAKGRKASYTLEGGQSVSYTYDFLDRLVTIQKGTQTFTYTYSGASPLVQSLIRPNGSHTEYQYDTLNRLTGLTNKRSGGTIINQYVYSYNDQDLRASETVTNGAPIALATESTTYNYNNVNQLISSSGSNSTFLYDSDGNMIQGYTPGGYALDAYYDAQNRLGLLQYRGPDQCSIPGYPEYTDSCPHNKVFHYRYDGILAQIEKEDGFYPAVTTVTNYVNDGILTLQERDGNNNVLREYIWGLNYGGGIGGLLGLLQAGQDYYYFYDGKGNVTAVLDSSENVIATYAYDPFGKLMTKTGSLNQPYQFSTKPYDEEVGLSYYGYRFYSPEIGRWINRDPIGEAGGLNLYGFAWDNPLSYIDPNGEFIVPILIGAGIGVGYVFIDWWVDRDTANEVMEKSAKRTGEKALKKLTNTNVPKPADCKEYEDILKGTKETTEEGVDPYRRVMGKTIRGINEGMTGSNSNTPLGTAPQRKTPSQWENR
jgi:RHS repeat-associated protein